MLIPELLRRHWNLFSALILVASAAWTGLTANVPIGEPAGKISAPGEGFQAPEIVLNDLAGRPTHLSDYLGRPVLINFWASWCPPCRAEMAAIEKVYQAYQGQGLVVLGIDAAYQDSLPDVQAFITQQALSFTVLSDADGAVNRRYRVAALPTSFFVDRRGSIHKIVVGGPMAEALLRAQIEEMLLEAP